MNGYDCQLYERLKQKVEDAELRMETKGDTIMISTCGGFPNVDDAYAYMCGYEHGMSRRTK